MKYDFRTKGIHIRIAIVFLLALFVLLAEFISYVFGLELFSDKNISVTFTVIAGLLIPGLFILCRKYNKEDNYNKDFLLYSVILCSVYGLIYLF